MDNDNEKKLRALAIRIINELYPADSDRPETAKIGKMLLNQAEQEVNGWQNKPTNVLVRYARLCEGYNRKVEQTILNQNKKSYDREMGDD